MKTQGEDCPLQAEETGPCLSPQLAEDSPLPVSSHHLPSVPVSKFPLFIRTPVIFNYSPLQ